MNNRHLLGILLFIVLAGCASTPEVPPPGGEDTSFYLGRFDKVWDVTLEELKKESLQVKDLNKEKGEIMTKFANYIVGSHAHQELENVAYKPEIPRLGLYTQVAYSLTIRLTPINDMSTQVNVTAHVEAYDTNETKKWLECRSKGVIEQRFLEKLRSSL